MATATSRRTAPADAIETLAEHFDPDVLDLRRGRARVRLEAGPGTTRDAGIAGRRMRLRDADESAPPDAVLGADPATWARIAADFRGGMEAFRAGRLGIRGSLHVGVGFLAATSGSDEPGRLGVETGRTPVDGAWPAGVRDGPDARVRRHLRAVGGHRPRDDPVRARPGRDEGVLP